MIDRRRQTQGRFSRDRFTYDGEADAYICPEGETLSHVGIDAHSQANVYRASPNRCRPCPQKKACTRGRARKLSVSWHEPARQSVRELAKTGAYQRSRRQRYKVERLFGELQDAHQPETVASTPPEERLRAVPHGRHRPKPQETGQAPRPARGQTRLKDEKGRPERKNDDRKINPAKTAPPKPPTFSTASVPFRIPESHD